MPWMKFFDLQFSSFFAKWWHKAYRKLEARQESTSAPQWECLVLPNFQSCGWENMGRKGNIEAAMPHQGLADYHQSMQREIELLSPTCSTAYLRLPLQPDLKLKADKENYNSFQGPCMVCQVPLETVSATVRFVCRGFIRECYWEQQLWWVK